MYPHQHGATHYQQHLTQDEQQHAQMAFTHNDHLVNRAISYDDGPYAGRTIRVRLVEAQKADLGRKFARRDRRPLDPPNVAEAFFYEVTEYGERPIPAEEVDTDGLLCHVDMFSVIGNTPGGPNVDLNQPNSLRIPPVPESRVTQDLWGTTFTHAARLPRCPSLDYGRPSDDQYAIYFAFPDLSVSSEGLFFFRYRVFDIKRWTLDSHSVGMTALERPVMAEVYGGLLKVYSTKEFPGLKASTALTKHLSLHGIKVNLRETARKRAKRKRSDDEEAGADNSISPDAQMPIEDYEQ